MPALLSAAKLNLELEHNNLFQTKMEDFSFAGFLPFGYLMIRFVLCGLVTGKKDDDNDDVVVLPR